MTIELPGLPVYRSSVPRRILLLITDLLIGGTPTVVRELAIRLNALPDVQIEVACLAPWGPVADELKAAGICVTAFGANGSADLTATVRRLLQLILGEPDGIPFDTVFSFLMHANAVAAIATRFCRGAKFIQSIQTTQAKPYWHWHIQRFAALAAEKIVVPSESVALVAGQRSGVPRDKITVIPNAVDITAFEKSPIPQTNPRPYPIVFLGRLDPIKRLPDLLAAVKLLGNEVRLDIFGEGAEQPKIEADIHRLGISDCVKIHGAISRPQDALREAGMLVLPSDAEGFGLVLIEAMASGVPVVATRVPGIRDVVIDGTTGLLVPPRGPIALAGAIRKIVEDVNLRRKLIENGQVDVARRFNWDAVLIRYQKLLQI